MYPVIRLKSGREKSLTSRHPWVFSGAIERPAEIPEPGDLVQVETADGQSVGVGSWSNASMIAIRLYAFEPVEISSEWLAATIRRAIDRRARFGFGPKTGTTGYRVVYGESDELPGLVVDRYNDVLVLQIGTAGMERFRQDIVACLNEICSPAAIYEKSDMPGRSDENLPPQTGLLSGELPEPMHFLEHGRTCIADVVDGQKTGFFLDQRNLRQEIVRLASNCTSALDLFSYTGASAVAALLAGCSKVTCVDSSERALTLCHEQASLNDIEADRITTVAADVFQWLGDKSEPSYDLVMLDPPALIKSQKHVESGRKGYHFLNRAALRLVQHDGLFVSSSCSAFFGEDDLMVTLRRASEQAGVTLDLLATVRQAEDHPLSLYFPESAYLKSFICRVRRR